MTPTALFIALLILNFALRLKIRDTSSTWFLKLIFTLGVPFHEAAHYIFAKLLFLKVTKTQFLPNFKDQNQMAYVQFIPRRGVLGALANMLVGLAPLLLGSLALKLLYNYEANMQKSVIGPLSIGLASVIVMQSMIPSWQDIRIALNGMFITSTCAALVYLALPEIWAQIKQIDLTTALVITNPYLVALAIYQTTAVFVLSCLFKSK